MKIPHFNTRKELFDFLTEKKGEIIAYRKEIIKHADGIPYTPVTGGGIEIKQLKDSKVVQVKAAINTTNILDSHGDVHIPGLWDKSLQENKRILHLQEHKLEFDRIIAEGTDVKASAEMMKWKELGYDFAGSTQVLMFDSTVREEVNAKMAKMYRDGRVHNHSVGMRYVKMVLCVNDDDYGAEFEAWEKYYSQVANKQQADESGYFWAITEAKVIEGSAVPLGSNQMTPTISVKGEPPRGTRHDEPPEGTQGEAKQFFMNILKNSQ